MILKKATMEDAKMLLEWRNDPLTRSQSISTDEIKLVDHEVWLKKTLANPDRELFVAFEEDVPVGTCRIDRELKDDEFIFELSWTIAPSARGKGMGKKMISELLNRAEIQGKVLKAVIKNDNIPSIKMAEAFGFKMEIEKNAITEWFKRIS